MTTTAHGKIHQLELFQTWTHAAAFLCKPTNVDEICSSGQMQPRFIYTKRSSCLGLCLSQQHIYQGYQSNTFQIKIQVWKNALWCRCECYMQIVDVTLSSLNSWDIESWYWWRKAIQTAREIWPVSCPLFQATPHSSSSELRETKPIIVVEFRLAAQKLRVKKCHVQSVKWRKQLWKKLFC